MSHIDFTKYRSVDEIVADIKSITIQGATNVAIATFEGMKLFLKNDQSSMSVVDFKSQLQKMGDNLANARPNEPLAKNGVKYVFYYLNQIGEAASVGDVKYMAVKLCDEYLEMIEKGKDDVVDHGVSYLKDPMYIQSRGQASYIMTHCHSSTVVKLLSELSKGVQNFRVVCTETRPLYQGRTTAAELVQAGLDTTMTVDSAAESYILGTNHYNVNTVFIGCDQISLNGDVINKVGSLGLALAARECGDPLYVIGSILKVDPENLSADKAKIEQRDKYEVWDQPPEGLKIFNPAFEIVPHNYIAGFVTELGVLSPAEIEPTLRSKYPWLFNEAKVSESPQINEEAQEPISDIANMLQPDLTQFNFTAN